MGVKELTQPGSAARGRRLAIGVTHCDDPRAGAIEEHVKRLAHSSFILCAVASLAVVSVATMQRAGSPLLKELNAIAQRQLHDRRDAIAAIRDQAAAEARKTDVRRRILTLIGGLPEYRGPLQARVTKTTAREGFSIEHVLFASLPDYYVTANLYRPDRAGRHPAVLMSMGHWESGKAAGQLLSANLARKGFVVLAYDPVGQGERQQAYDARVGRSLIGGPTEQHFSNGAAAILMGHSVARYFIHDGMRAIDYLVSRSDVDPERIGAIGCSGGGTQTTYIAALDTRVKAAAVACYMNSFQTLFAGSIGDSEQSVPGFLAAGLDQTDYVEQFAPKPWLIASTEGDFFTPAGARQVFEEAQRWYRLYGAQDRIDWVVGPGGHGTPLVVREAIYRWMIRWLADGKGDARDEAVTLLPDHQLMVTARGQVDGRELYQIIRDTPRQAGSPAELRTFVGDLMARNTPLVRSAKIFPAAAGTVKRPAVVLVQDTLTPDADARQLMADGSVVVLVSLSGRGGDAERPRSGNWMNNTRAWLVGRNLPAMHAAEINAAVAEAAGRADVDAGRISARASGVSGVALLLAAAVNPQIASVSLDRTPHSVRAAIDTPVHTNLHDAVIPGFAAKWDLADLRELLRPRSVVWRNPTDWSGNVVALEGDYTYSASDPNAGR
jgi:dienelactone hydrolase